MLVRLHLLLQVAYLLLQMLYLLFQLLDTLFRVCVLVINLSRHFGLLMVANSKPRVAVF